MSIIYVGEIKENTLTLFKVRNNSKTNKVNRINQFRDELVFRVAMSQTPVPALAPRVDAPSSGDARRMSAAASYWHHFQTRQSRYQFGTIITPVISYTYFNILVYGSVQFIVKDSYDLIVIQMGLLLNLIQTTICPTKVYVSEFSCGRSVAINSIRAPPNYLNYFGLLNNDIDSIVLY